VRGEFTPELVLVNSHNRSCAYQLHVGLYRFICGNGLVVASDTFERVSIRHSGFTPEEIIEASFSLFERIPALTSRIESFQQRELTQAESLRFAEAALRLRFENPEKAPIRPEPLLERRRVEDIGTNLWKALNCLQENLICGGQRDLTRRRPDG